MINNFEFSESILEKYLAHPVQEISKNGKETKFSIASRYLIIIIIIYSDARDASIEYLHP